MKYRKHRVLGGIRKYIVYGLVALVAVVVQQLPEDLAIWLSRDSASSLSEAWENQQSKVWLELDAEVLKTLPDDKKGNRHQRFLIDAGIGRSVLVAHNIDLADRVPVRSGVNIKLFGRYEWNEKGGVVHWTHHDPSGRRAGGWIEVAGKRYR